MAVQSSGKCHTILAELAGTTANQSGIISRQFDESRRNRKNIEASSLGRFGNPSISRDD